MTKTQDIFNKAILKSAELVKMINEDGFEQDSKEVEDINDEIAILEMKLQDLPYDFDEINNLRKYIESVIGKDYFFDKRCWGYLSDVVFEIENNIAWSL